MNKRSGFVRYNNPNEAMTICHRNGVAVNSHDKTLSDYKNKGLKIQSAMDYLCNYAGYVKV